MMAVTFALPAESSSFIARLTNKRRSPVGAGGEVIQGNIRQRPIVVFHTGVGREVCQERLNRFFALHHPDLLISSGFAGGVGARCEAGDLFLAENFSDAELLLLAERILRGEETRRGKLFTSPSLIDSATEREEIAGAHGADAVDMETEVIARACAAHGLPMLALRVVSDTAREPFPLLPALVFNFERQKPKIGALGRHLITRPFTIGKVFRFARQIRRARENLTRALTKLAQDTSLGS